MNALVKQQDQDFIARFLATYKSLSEESQNLVLATLHLENQEAKGREGRKCES